MSDVERSAYRQPVTPSGLEAIEKGTLTWLDEDMYNNLNTGLLEQYLEEKNLQDSFEISHWDTRKVLIGILIGAVFSGVTAYIGLKIGLAVSAAWYVAYLLGMALKWSPSEVNIATSATTGATHASTAPRLVMTTNSFLVNNLDPSEMQGGAKLYFRQVHFSNVMVVMLLITSFQVRQQMPSELKNTGVCWIGMPSPANT